MRAQLIWKLWLSLTRAPRVQTRRRAYFQLLLQRLESSASAGPKIPGAAWVGRTYVPWWQARVHAAGAKQSWTWWLDISISDIKHVHQSIPCWLCTATWRSTSYSPFNEGNCPQLRGKVWNQWRRSSSTRTASVSNPRIHCTVLARLASAALRKFQKLIVLIRDEAFRPDANRSGMVTPRPPPTPTARPVTPMPRVAPVGSGLPSLVRGSWDGSTLENILLAHHTKVLRPLTQMSLARHYSCGWALVIRKVHLQVCRFAHTITSAYRQLGLCHEGRRYIRVHDPHDKKMKLFQATVLPFGAVRSVHSFLKCAGAIWWLGVVACKLLWASFYDDYICFSGDALVSSTDLTVVALFKLINC